MNRLWILCLWLSFALDSSAQPPALHISPLSETNIVPVAAKVAVEGNRLYAASGYGLEVFDISDIEHYQSIGRTPTYGIAEYIAVKDSFAYVMEWDRGWSAFDVRDPRNIRQTFSRDNPNTLFQDIYIFGDLLYVCEWYSGVVIYSLEDPAQPVRIGFYRGTRLPMAFALDDSIAVALDATNDNLMIMSADFHNPVTYSTVRINEGYLDDVCIQDTLVAVAEGDAGIKIFGISDPTHPNLIAEIATPDWAGSVSFRDNFLLAGVDGAGLSIFNLDDPANPDPVYTEGDYYGPLQILFHNNNVFLAKYWGGWTAYDVTNLPEPERLAAYYPPPSIYSLAVYNRHIYLPRGSYGLAVIDASDPAQPREIATIDSNRYYRAVATDDGWLYTIDWIIDDSSYALSIWNLQEPENPEIINSILLNDYFGSLLTKDNLLVLLNSRGVSEIWDISERNDPTPLSSIQDMFARNGYIDSDRLYLCNGDGQASIYDISSPEFPSRIGIENGLDYAYGICARGNRMFVGDGDNGVIVFDVSNPENIRRIGSEVTGWCVNVTISDSLLFVCDHDHGFHVYDITNGVSPEMVGYIDTPGYAYNAVIIDCVAYIADYFDLTICRYEPENGVGGEKSITAGDFRLSSPFPNPANGMVRIEYEIPVGVAAVLKIVASDGREIYSRNLQSQGSTSGVIPLDITGLPAGNYFLRLESLVGISTERVLLVK